MQALLILLVLSLMLVRVRNDQGMLVQLLWLLGINRRLTRFESTFALIVGVLVFLALFVAIQPEAGCEDKDDRLSHLVKLRKCNFPPVWLC
jgi:formate hydrogenlyase subunit 3/multisubunit Na+/H+ antiporter MnhD subunit